MALRMPFYSVFDYKFSPADEADGLHIFPMRLHQLTSSLLAGKRLVGHGEVKNGRQTIKLVPPAGSHLPITSWPV